MQRTYYVFFPPSAFIFLSSLSGPVARRSADCCAHTHTEAHTKTVTTQPWPARYRYGSSQTAMMINSGFCMVQRTSVVKCRSETISEFRVHNIYDEDSSFVDIIIVTELRMF